MFYKYELGHNADKAAKNIFGTKGEGTIDNNIVTRWFKKFCLGFKNLNYLARSGKSKTVDSETPNQRGKSSE